MVGIAPRLNAIKITKENIRHPKLVRILFFLLLVIHKRERIEVNTMDNLKSERMNFKNIQLD